MALANGPHRSAVVGIEVAHQMCETVKQLLGTPVRKRTATRNKAAALADKAQWKHFIKYYYEAYHFALSRVELSTNEN